MSATRLHDPGTSVEHPADPPRTRALRDLFTNPWLLGFAALWVASSVYLLAFSDPELLRYANPEPIGYLTGNAGGLVTIAVLLALARSTRPIDHTSGLGLRRPGLETAGLLAWFALVVGVGSLLGIRTHIAFVGLDEGSLLVWGQQTVTSVLTWAGYNAVGLGLAPYLVFRHLLGYSHASMLLPFRNPRVWLPYFVVVGFLGIAFVLPPDYFSTTLSAHLLTAALYTFGSILPVMIATQCLLAPRLAVLTRSWVTGAVLSAIVYAALNITEFFLDWSTPEQALASAAWVAQVAFWGLMKGITTLRTGNAWLHIATTHTIHYSEAPAIARVFGLR